jgi:hypothetical protein
MVILEYEKMTICTIRALFSEETESQNNQYICREYGVQLKFYTQKTKFLL